MSTSNLIFETSCPKKIPLREGNGIEAAGVRVVMPEPGRLRLIGSDDARAKVKGLVLEHRQEIAEHLAASAPPSPLDREEAAPDREETPQEMVARYGTHLALLSHI